VHYIHCVGWVFDARGADHVLRPRASPSGRGGVPRKIKLSDETRQWLHANHAQFTVEALSQALGCHPDTTKRILMREGLRWFSGAKYTVARVHTEKADWRRPCIVCGCKKSRSKWQYRCDKCTEKYSD
jgi:hypothetical protein